MKWTHVLPTLVLQQAAYFDNLDNLPRLSRDKVIYISHCILLKQGDRYHHNVSRNKWIDTIVLHPETR